MGQRIVIKILGNPFELVADSPEQEADIRNAADKVNEKYHEYVRRFPGRLPADIFSFIAVNAFVELADERRKGSRTGDEAERLHKDLKSYLDNIEI